MNVEGFKHRMVPVGDVKMHSVIGGNGPPLVLIHGFPQTWWEWRHMMPQLASRHTVVAVDLRGAGHSDKPQGGYDKASLAGDVHGVMAALGFDKYAVCGHDIGAGARPDAPRCRHALDGARRVSARLEPVDGELARAEGLAVRLPHEARPAGAAHPRANSITSQPLSTTGPAIWSASGRGHRGIRAVPQAARKLEGRA